MRVVFIQRIRRVVALCLAAALLLGTIHEQLEIMLADEAKTAMIYSSDKSLVQTYKKPSTSATAARRFKFGKTVTVIDEVMDESGTLWYKLQYTLDSTGESETSYCPAEYVDIDEVFAYGTVNSNEINLRNYAGTSGTTVLAVVDKGEAVEMLNETTVSGNTWYRVRYTNSAGTVYLGWMYGSYITLDRYNVEIDEAYVEELKAKGFPESYTYNLAVLHALYPDWIFEPVLTGLDWNAVITAESKPNLNLVSVGADDAKKSVASADYDWETNTWVLRDNGSWVTIHPEYLAYVMDPRNFLTANYIFQFESLSYSEAHTIEGVQAVFGSSFLSKDATEPDGSTLNYAEALMSIGKEVNVSPYHLASRVLQEQGSAGTSTMISGTYSGYEGYYNYFNYGASGTTSAEVIANGMKYAYKQGWNSRYKSLLGGSTLLANNYIAKGQDTLYFQKFNVVYTDKLYSHQYMQNATAAMSEGLSIAKAYTDKQQAFVFRIPVYENMPAEAVQFTTSGNRNNYLSDITVSGLSLSPTFKGATTSYTLTVGNSISSISVSATPVVSESTVTGTGTHKLEVGTNTIKIMCVSESGDSRTYTLTVVREAAETETPDTPSTEPGTEEPGTDEPSTDEPGTDEPGTDEPSTDEPGTDEPSADEPGTSEPTEPEIPAGVTSDKYVIGTYITGVKPETTASNFLAGFICVGGAEVKLLDKKGAVNSGTVATGNVLAIYDDGELIASHEIVIYGDVSGDGKVTILDIMKINRHTLKISTLSGSYLAAGDVNKNGNINILDIMITNRHTLGLSTIEQK